MSMQSGRLTLMAEHRRSRNLIVEARGSSRRGPSQRSVVAGSRPGNAVRAAARAARRGKRARGGEGGLGEVRGGARRQLRFW